MPKLIRTTALRVGAGLALTFTVLTAAAAQESSSAWARPSSVPADTLYFSLPATVRRSLDASPEVSAVASRRESALARADLARASRFLTDFSLTTAHAPSPGLKNPNETPTDRLYLDPDVRNDWGNLSMFNQIEVGFLQPVHTWGELSGTIRAARQAVLLEDASVREKEVTVALRSADLYYSLLLTEALQRVVADAGDVVERAKREIDRLLQEGAADVDDADLFQVLITEQEFKRRVVEADESHRTAAMALRRQLFLPDDVVVRTTDKYLEPISVEQAALDNYIRIGLQNRPELDAAAAGLSARDALVRVARADYFPKLFVSGKYRLAAAAGRYRQRNPYVSDRLIGSGFEAGLGVRLQLNYAQTGARVEQARAQRNEVGFQLEGLRQLVQFEVEESYRSLRIKAAALTAQQEALRLSKEWLQMESVNFDLELGDTENLVRAVQANLQLQAAENQAIYDHNIAVLRLYRACGILIPWLESGTFVVD